MIIQISFIQQSNQLGHSNPTTTLRYYAKWLLNQNDQFIELLGGSEEASNSDEIEEVL